MGTVRRRSCPHYGNFVRREVARHFLSLFLAFSTLIKSVFWTFSFTCPQVAEKSLASNDSIRKLQTFSQIKTTSGNFKVGEIKEEHLQNYSMCEVVFPCIFSFYTAGFHLSSLWTCLKRWECKCSQQRKKAVPFCHNLYYQNFGRNSLYTTDKRYFPLPFISGIPPIKGSGKYLLLVVAY